MPLSFHQFPYMSDNYGVLIRSDETGEVAMIDAGEAGAAMAALGRTGWVLSHIFVTHHHGDHVAGLSEVKAATGAEVIGPGVGDRPIEGVDRKVVDGERFAWGGREVTAIHTPGHTLDMINYHFADDGVVFTGDTLFTLGCGRVFEGDPAMMWASLSKLMALPPETVVYSSHEYTLANAKFALSVDPGNAALKARATEVEAIRARGEATSPTVLSAELETNPFLRAADPGIRAGLGLEAASDAEVFAAVRKAKDNF